MRRVLPLALALALTGCRPDVVSHDLGVKFAPPEAPATFPVERPITLSLPPGTSSLTVRIARDGDQRELSLERSGPDGSREMQRTSERLPNWLGATGGGVSAASSDVGPPEGARKVVVVTTMVKVPVRPGERFGSLTVSGHFAVERFPSQGWERRIELEYFNAGGKRLPSQGNRPW